MRHLLLLPLLLMLIASGCSQSPKVHVDNPQSRILPSDSLYHITTFHQPDDYSGTVISTLLRRPATVPSQRAILYIHGFNDYFFNNEMADSFTRAGYNFYALDLRKYGRSLLPGQPPFEARSLKEYFPDIDSALCRIALCNSRIALMGHSTGGLLAALYTVESSSRSSAVPAVDALLLNSPFLDWNLGKTELFIPMVSFLGWIAPDFRISQGDNQTYANSLLKSRQGYCDYDTTLKLPQSPDVTAGWVRAISMAQRRLRNSHHLIAQPTLLMLSDSSYHGDPQQPSSDSSLRDRPLASKPLWMRSDAVLDVNDIMQYGADLSTRETILIVPGGLHDLLLSDPAVRHALYPRIIKWLDANIQSFDSEP